MHPDHASMGRYRSRLFHHYLTIAVNSHSGGWTDKRGPSPGSLLYQPTTEGAARPAREAVRPAARQPVTGKGGYHDSHINHHRGGRYTMNGPASITITPVRVADLLAEGERMPLYSARVRSTIPMRACWSTPA